MYESYFKLNAKPFDLSPDPQFLYMSTTHRRAMNYLQYGVSERAGFILLTGEVGSGKTTLIRELINSLKDEAVIARVFNTQVNSAQLLGLINMDFGLNVTTLDKAILLKDLNDFLIDCYANKEKPLLVIDEAQNLSAEALEEVRLLSNLESENEKLLQIIMVGQPELQTMLEHESLMQLRQRLSVSCHLGALTEQETSDYFYHRLECAGNRSAVTIPEKSFSEIYRLCRGVPRLINIFGDYLLLATFNDKLNVVTADFIEEMISELENTIAFSRSRELSHEYFNAGEGSWSQDLKVMDSLLLIRDYDNKDETVLKRIIRQQIVQIDRLQDQLDAIGSSLHSIESEMKELTKKSEESKPDSKTTQQNVISKIK